MAFRAFVARSGWNKTPISAQEWREAAAALPELELHAGLGGEPVRAMLRGSRRRGVILQQGYLCGEHVDSRLVSVMFALAELLGAQVFSEARRPYSDLSDWQMRNAQRRRSRPRRSQAAIGTRTVPAQVATAESTWVQALMAGVVTCLLVMWILN
jgi:hypothetical protein